MSRPRTTRAAGLENDATAARTRPLDETDREVFDRTADLATRLLDVPVALITAVEGDQLVFSSCVGPDEPWRSRTGILFTHSACQHAIASGRPLPITDARRDALVRESPVIGELGIGAYLGVPLALADGVAFGTLCAIDTAPRTWSETDVRVLEDLGASLTAYIDGRPEQQAELPASRPAAAGLNIAAVARRTGVAPDTLRKWERRYGVLRPQRTAGGQRRYDEGDVARVEWLRDRLREGFRIGEAAALLDQDGASASSSPDALREALVEATRDAAVPRLSALVEQAFTLNDVDVAVEQIVSPALRAVGDRWSEGAHCIAEERLLSEVVLARMRSLLRDRRAGVRGTAVLACAPGERHELGLLTLAVLLQADGWLALYLGPNTPLDSALAMAERADADLLCLSATTAESLEELSGFESSMLPPGTQLVIGGAALEDGRPLAEVTAALRESVTPRA